MIGACFLLLAAYVAYEAGHAVITREVPDHTTAGIALAVARRALGIALYVGGSVAVAVATWLLGSPWLAAKGFAIAASCLPFAAMIAAGRLRGRTRLGSAALFTAITVGVLWSNALAYRDVNLAPRDQLAELQTIGHVIAGQGPTLMTEYEPYGARHFLRDAAPEGASELRRRVVPLIGGGTLGKGMTADTDRFRLSGLLVYRTLVLRRSPAQSRPPSPYRLIWRGEFYEVWQRPAAYRRRLIEHRGLGTATDPGGIAGCRMVRRLAQEAGPGGELAVSFKAGESGVEAALSAVRAAGVHIKDLATEDPDLEDVFMALTYGDPNAVDPTRD